MSTQITTPHEPRPEWVVQAIAACTQTTNRIQEAQETVRGLALRLNAHDVAITAPLVEADHDLEHAYAHVVSVRRGLRMSWPIGDDDVPPHVPS